MKRNIFIFHGTEGYPDENWFPWMKLQLETRGHKVFVPQFPSPPVVPSKISGWFDVLREYRQYIDEHSVLIGHSLGGIFILRILEELTQSIYGAAFVGTPIGIKPILNYDRDNAFSGFSFDWNGIKNKSQKFIVFHSDNDPYVSLGNGEQLAKELGVKLSFVPNAGHFNARAGYLQFESLLVALESLPL